MNYDAVVSQYNESRKELIDVWKRWRVEFAPQDGDDKFKIDVPSVIHPYMIRAYMTGVAFIGPDGKGDDESVDYIAREYFDLYYYEKERTE